MSTIFYKDQTTYFFIGKCFNLQNPLALAYLSQLQKTTDKAKFRGKLEEAEEYARSQSPDEGVIGYLRCYYLDDVKLNPENLAEKKKQEEYTKLLFTDDCVPYTVKEVYESIKSFNSDISMINASLDYYDTYVGFLIPNYHNIEGCEIGVHYCGSLMNSGWGTMVDPVIEKFIKIFGLNPNLDILDLDENHIVEGKNHPFTLPLHICY